MRKNYVLANCDNENETIIVNLEELTFTDPSCGTCPPGFVFDNDLQACVREDIVSAGIGVNVITAYGGVDLSKNTLGTYFYPVINDYALPLYNNNNVVEDQSAQVVNHVFVGTSPIWKEDGTGFSRYNKLNVSPGSAFTANSYMGYAYCVNGSRKKIYVGVSSSSSHPSKFRIKLNGNEMVVFNVSASGEFSSDAFHVFPINLIAGNNILEIDAVFVSGSDGKLAFEVYDKGYEAIGNITSELALSAYTIISSKNEVKSFFDIGDTNNHVCPAGYALNVCVSPTQCIDRDIIYMVDCEYPVLKFEEYPCKCWKYVEEADQSLIVAQLEPISSVNDCEECYPVDNPYEERTRAFLSRVKIPVTFEQDRGFNECCYQNIVLADSTTEASRNDFTGFWHKRSIDAETVEFKLVDANTSTEILITDNTYGDYKDYGMHATQPDLATFICEWHKVLSVLGEGAYYIKKVINISGIITTINSNTFQLKTFSHEQADYTVRFDSYMDGKLHDYDVDFKGTGFKTSLRTIGFFGRPEWSYTEENVIYTTEEVDQVSMDIEMEYQFQVNRIPDCIAYELMEFMMLGNDLYINDYNSANFSYLLGVPVKFKSNKGSKYFTSSRHAQINLTFGDKFKTKRKTNC